MRILLVSLIIFTHQAFAIITPSSVDQQNMSVYGIYTTTDPTCQSGLTATMPLSVTPKTINFSDALSLIGQGGSAAVSSGPYCIVLVVKNNLTSHWLSGNYTSTTWGNSDSVCNSGGTNSNPICQSGTSASWPSAIQSAMNSLSLSMTTSCSGSTTEIIPVYFSTYSQCSGVPGVDCASTSTPVFPNPFTPPSVSNDTSAGLLLPNVSESYPIAISGYGAVGSNGSSCANAGAITVKVIAQNACSGGPYFSQTALANDNGYIPLGNLNPPGGHIFPVNHLYIQPKSAGGGNQPPYVNDPVRIPGAAKILSIVEVRDPSTEAVIDYTINFSPCYGIRAYYNHVKTLNSTFLANLLSANHLASLRSDKCITTDGKMCYTAAYMDVSDLSTVLGTTSSSNSLDLGVFDTNLSEIGYSNSAHYTIDPSLLISLNANFNSGDAGFFIPDYNHARCPLNYMNTTTASTINSDLVSFMGPLNVSSACQAIMQDSSTSIKGNWFYSSNSSVLYEGMALAFVSANYDTSINYFSVGNQLSNLPVGAYTYDQSHPSGSYINQDFSSVTDINHSYCFDLTGIASTKSINTKFSGTTLLVKVQNDTCANTSVSGDWPVNAGGSGVSSFSR